MVGGTKFDELILSVSVCLCNGGKMKRANLRVAPGEKQKYVAHAGRSKKSFD